MDFARRLVEADNWDDFVGANAFVVVVRSFSDLRDLDVSGPFATHGDARLSAEHIVQDLNEEQATDYYVEVRPLFSPDRSATTESPT